MPAINSNNGQRKYNINFPLPHAFQTPKNRGPRIQSVYKIWYFNNVCLDFPLKFAFDLGNQFKNPDWQHYLFVSEILCSNCSYGPNISGSRDLGQEMPKFDKKVFKNKDVVADSNWAKEELMDLYGINSVNVKVIPILIPIQFFNFKAQFVLRKRFTIGLVGYFDQGIKNLDAILPIAERHPDWRFEICISRPLSTVPFGFRNSPNIKIYANNLEHKDMPKIYSEWSCYLGISKVERGPAAMQECNVIGCPTICSNHTGYSEFKPMISLNITPHKSLSTADIGKVEEALDYVCSKRDEVREAAIKRRHDYWRDRTPIKIVRSWKEFFINNLKFWDLLK